MKRLPIALLLALLSLLALSCENVIEIDTPPVDPDGIIPQTTPLPASSRPVMDGIYAVTAGTDLLGETVVVKWTRDRLTIFSGKEAAYVLLDGGSIDSTLHFLGSWRSATSSSTGAANFTVGPDSGATAILDGDTTFTAITLSGTYGEGTEGANRPLTLRFQRRISPSVLAEDFDVMAHRGGGRNSEYLGVSENTIEMVAIAERFGSTGVEIDLRLSKDGVPFVYHDADVNLRLTQKGPVWGAIEDFTWPQLRTLIVLRNGERIPSAREMLEYILLHTNLRTVWLDTKDVDVLPASITLQREILARADSMGRDLEIYIGIPAQDIYDAFIATAGHDTIPSLCELGVDKTREANSMVWAPRWTEGTQSALVDEIHGEGRKAYVWTLDDAAYIEEFVNNGGFDAILTNYPTIVSYYHYIR